MNSCSEKNINEMMKDLDWCLIKRSVKNLNVLCDVPFSNCLNIFAHLNKLLQFKLQFFNEKLGFESEDNEKRVEQGRFYCKIFF